MQRVRQSDTKPERAVRAILTRARVRYRLSNRDLPGSPDIANRRKRWAIFVHGCFWHGHTNCKAARLPRSNRAFWSAKVASNRSRDYRVVHELKHLGFRVLTVWQCTLKSDDKVAKTITKFAGG
jgi:DNA mismatch endonuclease (patch repair protein)